ncbi:MAG: hypothetical protein ACRECD_01250 [Burkholderiaceae bacterium]
MHRGLKPTNVIVVGGYSLTDLKVTDFGIAKMADEESAAAAEGGDATAYSGERERSFRDDERRFRAP